MPHPTEYLHDMKVIYETGDFLGARTVYDWKCRSCGITAGYPERAQELAGELCPARAPSWYMLESLVPTSWARIWGEIIALGVMMAAGAYALGLLWKVLT